MKPVLFLTGHAPADRVGAFQRLAEREHVEFAFFGGRVRHAGPPATELPVPHLHIHQRAALRLARGDYRAVVCSTGGRVALPLGWAGARRAGTPVILWSSLWAHPRSPAHALSFLVLRRLYRTADALVTYGPHVSAYVSALGARNVHVAPQSVDNAFWSAPAEAPAHAPWPSGGGVRFLFVGRPEREKGLEVLLSAWRCLGLAPEQATLVLAGVERHELAGIARGARELAPDGGVRCLGWSAPPELRNFYGAADVLVVPSIPTRTFREPWGLVVNEAFNQQLPAIASDAVGAAAGGLARDGVDALIVPAGDPEALAQAMRVLAEDPELRSRLGSNAAEEVRSYTHEAWAEGFSSALASLGLSIHAAARSGRAGSVAR
jgi:glycosyltransferase involved in cell wall biosynthesis